STRWYAMRTRAAVTVRSGAAEGTPRIARSTGPGGSARQKYLVMVVSRSSTIASLGQRRLQDGLAAGELTLDRVDGDAPDAGKVLVREPVDVVERQEQPRLPRHPVESARQVDPLHRRRRRRARRALRGRPPPAQLVDAHVGERVIEPGGDGPARRVRAPGGEALEQ